MNAVKYENYLGESLSNYRKEIGTFDVPELLASGLLVWTKGPENFSVKEQIVKNAKDSTESYAYTGQAIKTEDKS